VGASKLFRRSFNEIVLTKYEFEAVLDDAWESIPVNSLAVDSSTIDVSKIT
jgi:hypothetical protein